MLKLWWLVVVVIALILLEGGARLYYTVSGSVPDTADSSQRNEWEWAQQHLAAGTARIDGMAQYEAELGWVPDGDFDTWSARQLGVVDSRKLRAAATRKLRAAATRKLRAAATRKLRAAADRPQLWFFGDSYTYGLYVDRDQAFPQVIQRDLPHWHVANFGVSGYGPDQMLLAYERLERAHQIRAGDTVVLGFFVRGIDRLLPFTFYAKPYFEFDTAGALALRGVPVMSPADLYQLYVSGERHIGGRSYVFDLLGAGVERIARQRSAADTPRWHLMAALLARFGDEVQRCGARPLLLIIPTELDDYAGSAAEEVDALAQAEALRLGITAMSLAPLLRSAESANATPTFRPRQDGGHLSVAGHAVVAAALLAALHEQAQM